MLYLGIDAGASSTKWACVDDAGSIKSGVVGPIDGHIQRSESLVRMRSTLSGIATASGGQISRIFIGITGIAEGSQERAETMSVIGEIFRDAQIELESDIHLAYRVHFPKEDGVLLYAGTGAVACTRVDGKLRRVGGWGYLLGDEGAGYWIGRQAIRSLLALVDKEEVPRLGSMESEIAAAIGGSDWATIKNFVYGRNRSEIAALARIVFSSQGEESSNAILAEAGDHLIHLVDRVDEITGDSRRGIIFTGGASQGAGLLNDRLIQKMGNRLSIVNRSIAEGAALLAKEVSSQG